MFSLFLYSVFAADTIKLPIQYLNNSLKETEVFRKTFDTVSESEIKQFISSSLQTRYADSIIKSLMSSKNGSTVWMSYSLDKVENQIQRFKATRDLARIIKEKNGKFTLKLATVEASIDFKALDYIVFYKYEGRVKKVDKVQFIERSIALNEMTEIYNHIQDQLNKRVSYLLEVEMDF